MGCQSSKNKVYIDSELEEKEMDKVQNETPVSDHGGTIQAVDLPTERVVDCSINTLNGENENLTKAMEDRNVHLIENEKAEIVEPLRNTYVSQTFPSALDITKELTTVLSFHHSELNHKEVDEDQVVMNKEKNVELDDFEQVEDEDTDSDSSDAASDVAVEDWIDPPDVNLKSDGVVEGPVKEISNEEPRGVPNVDVVNAAIKAPKVPREGNSQVTGVESDNGRNTKEDRNVTSEEAASSSFKSGKVALLSSNSGAKLVATSVTAPAVGSVIRDTKVVKKKKAGLPTGELPHPKPKFGDWLNSRRMINNYIILESLGSGSYAEVKLCKEKVTGGLYAMKFISRDIMKKSTLGKQNPFEDIKREIEIMKKLNHPNVLRLYEVMDDPKQNKLFLVLEYMKQGDLLAMQRTKSKDGSCEPMDDKELHCILLQVLLGLLYLHDQKVVHGDLKPQNLLVL